jgi:hypothetical protein
MSVYEDVRRRASKLKTMLSSLLKIEELDRFMANAL